MLKLKLSWIEQLSSCIPIYIHWRFLFSVSGWEIHIFVDILHMSMINAEIFPRNFSPTQNLVFKHLILNTWFMTEISVWERVIWLFAKTPVDLSALGCNGWKLTLITDCHKHLTGRSYTSHYITKLLVPVASYTELKTTPTDNESLQFQGESCFYI